MNGGYGWGQSRFDFGNGTTTGRFNMNGGMVGGTIGAQMQRSWFVFGVEGDGDWANRAPSPQIFGPFQNAPQKKISPRVLQISKELSRGPFIAAATANLVPRRETNMAPAVFMNNAGRFWHTRPIPCVDGSTS